MAGASARMGAARARTWALPPVRRKNAWRLAAMDGQRPVPICHRPRPRTASAGNDRVRTLDKDRSNRTPALFPAGRRWPVERTHSWMNGYGKLRQMTDRDAKIVGFYLYLAAAFVTLRALIQHARHRYRWDTRPATKRLK